METQESKESFYVQRARIIGGFLIIGGIALAVSIYPEFWKEAMFFLIGLFLVAWENISENLQSLTSVNVMVVGLIILSVFLWSIEKELHFLNQQIWEIKQRLGDRKDDSD